MASLKSKKAIKTVVIVAIVLVVGSIIFNGTNLVPFEFKNVPVSFLTPDSTWGSKPSNFIFKYGFPKSISAVNDIDGSREFNFNIEYDNLDVTVFADNSDAINNEFHRYAFTIDCKTPEDANNYFNECHEKMMEFYQDEPDFQFDGTQTETDYEFKDGSPCSYASSYKNGKEEVLILADDGTETPLEEADDVVEIKTKINEYDMCNTTGVFWRLSYSEGESTVHLRADILY